MCSMLSTRGVAAFSNGVVSLPSISSGFRPVYCQATAITGILMFGKMSVGVRKITTGLKIRINRAKTMNVYGRSNAMRTIHMELLLVGGVRKAIDYSGQGQNSRANALYTEDEHLCPLPGVPVGPAPEPDRNVWYSTK